MTRIDGEILHRMIHEGIRRAISAVVRTRRHLSRRLTVGINMRRVVMDAQEHIELLVVNRIDERNARDARLIGQESLVSGMC